jgi:hypothetical protein
VEDGTCLVFYSISHFYIKCAELNSSFVGRLIRKRTDVNKKRSVIKTGT